MHEWLIVVPADLPSALLRNELSPDLGAALPKAASCHHCCAQVAAGTIPPTLTPMPVNLTQRTRAEGDFATGQAAVTPQNRYVAPSLSALADSGAATGR